MGKRDGVSRILQLAEHLGVRELLRRIRRAQPEQRTHERGLAHILEREHVLGDGWLDDGVAHIGAPSKVIAREPCRPWVSAVIEVIVKRKPECLGALRKAPVWRTDKLVPSHERVLKPLMEQER